MDPSSANYPKETHTKNKRAGWKIAKEKSVKMLHSEERKEPYNTLNRTNNIKLSEKYPKGTTTKTHYREGALQKW